jgi:hypothetical protein
MPTKRTRATRGRRVLRLASLDINDLLHFGCGWSPLGSRGEPWADEPEEQARQRWSTWQAFLSDWELVRDEWAAQDQPFGPPRDETFAEWLYQQYGVKGPPEMPPDRDSRYPSVIPSHPVVTMFRDERERLDQIQGQRQRFGGQRP